MSEFPKKLSKKDAQGWLLVGALNADLEMIDKTLEAGADINHRYSVAPDQPGISALYVAVHRYQEDLAIALLNRGANPLEPGAKSPLKEAMYCGCDRFLDAVIASGYQLKDLAAFMAQYIHTAECKDTIASLNALLVSGEDVNIRDTDGRTPLEKLLRVSDMFSLMRLYVKALLDAGADIYVPTQEGRPLLESLPPTCNYLSVLTEHVDRLREHLIGEQSAGMEPQRLVKDGKPTAELLHYCGAHLLPELFASYRWKGKEAEALRIIDALPDYYKSAMDRVDLAPLRREAGGENDSAVKRYVRPFKAPEAGR